MKINKIISILGSLMRKNAKVLTEHAREMKVRVFPWDRYISGSSWVA